MLIKKKDYIIGLDHIRPKLTDKNKVRAVKFENGETIEVSEEELLIIPSGWYETVTEGVDDGN